MSKNTTENKEELEKMAEYIKEAQEALEKAMEIADKHSFSFQWDLAYGMGGWYEGKGTEEGYGNSTRIRSKGEWVSSSSGC